MTLQLLHSEFPYIWGKFDFLFYQCIPGMNFPAGDPLPGSDPPAAGPSPPHPRDTHPPPRLQQVFPDPTVQFIDEGTIKTTNPKCRLYCCLIEFIDWRYSQPYWYFRPLLWTDVAICTFSLTPPPLPSQSKRTEYTDSVWLWGVGGGGVFSCVVDHILQEFNTLFLTRFNQQNCYTIPNKNTSKDDV